MTSHIMDILMSSYVYMYVVEKAFPQSLSGRDVAEAGGKSIGHDSRKSSTRGINSIIGLLLNVMTCCHAICQRRCRKLKGANVVVNVSR